MAKCRRCGVDIRWEKTKRGKNTPVDLTGESHFATCVSRQMSRAEAAIIEARVNRKLRITTGEFYIEKEDDGVTPWEEIT